ncbi:hypothetical protein [Actinomycetospora chiangmaiensis]|uniref:hypothetical protein n=1 Tax=Actinomycetospora chiangmaiensis TaxID=402650 RepID=UPI000382D088|nr:hypothetical protein [Actinomycetospora chiangmaiensis]
MTRCVLPVLLLVALLAGCGSTGPGSPANPATAVRAAIVATAAAGPSRATLDGRTAVAGQEMPLQGQGVVDPRAQAADLTLQLPSLGAVRVVFAGGRLDAQLPPSASGLAGMVAGGKPWVSVDVDRLARSRYGAPLGALGVGTSQNPARQLAWLDAIRDDVREVGPEQVAGRDATHYAGVVDLDRVPGAQDPSTKPAVDLLKSQLRSSTLPVDLWVADGRLVKAAQTVTVPAQGTGAPTSTTTSLTFTDIGGAPAVVAPPADQVADLSGLLPTG